MSKNLAQAAGHVFPILVLMWLAGCAGSSNDSAQGGGTTGPTTLGGGGTSFSVGGAVSGLSGTVALQNNGGNDLSLSANSGFSFTTTAVTGSNYSVTVLTQPAGQTCAIANGAGTVSGANVTDVTVTCTSSLASLALFAGDIQASGSADGVGVAARFSGPLGVATDTAGNVYVADGENNTIRKITPAGVVTTLAGTVGVIGSADGTGAAASFHFPQGIATDSTGNVYVADFSNNTIRKITPAGVVTTLAGTAPPPSLGGPHAVMGGSADGTGAAAGFNGPTGIATDSAGNLYVGDTNNQTIRKITPAGAVTTLAGTAHLLGSTDATGAAARFTLPQGVATDSAGNVYVADEGNSIIRKITPAGVVTTLAGTAGVLGGTDATGAAASFRFPVGVSTDSAGNIYVADTGNHTIRKITPNGAVSTVVGVAGQAGFTPGALPGLLSSPGGVAVSGTSLYITPLNGVAVVQNRP
jgi:serine/threonine protein kinase, bacterial